MKFLFFILVSIAFLTTSCTQECDKTLNGSITDHISGEPISNVEIEVTGRMNSRSGFGARFLKYNTLSNERGEFSITTNDELHAWDRSETTIEGYITRTVDLPDFRNGLCGDNVVEITMQGIAFVDINTFDDTAKLGNRVHFYTEYPTLESTGIIDLGETFRIPVLEGEPFEIELVVYNTFDEMLSEETITVELGKGDVQEIEIGI